MSTVIHYDDTHVQANSNMVGSSYVFLILKTPHLGGVSIVQTLQLVTYIINIYQLFEFEGYPEFVTFAICSVLHL